jgi:hypothetical protein
MLIGVEKYIHEIPHDYGVKIKQITNAQSIVIDLERVPSSSDFGNALIFNGNQASLTLVSLGAPPTMTKIAGSVTFTATVSGTQITLTPSSRLWGLTTIIISADFDFAQ